MTNPKPRILVTSAAGRTGAATVLQLLEKGFPVRAFVRRRDARSEALSNAGAEIFVGDLYDFRDLRRAMTDVQRAYHCPPYAPNLLHGAMLKSGRSCAGRRAVRRARRSAWRCRRAESDGSAASAARSGRIRRIS